MALQIYPEATTSGSSVAGKAYTLTWQNVYKTTDSFSSGIYVITTSPTTYQAKVEFLLSNNTVVTATTVSGTVTVSLGQAATEVYMHVLESAGTGTILTITQTAATIGVSNYSGTLDTITTTSNYNQTGKLYVVAVGGGGNGAGSQSNSNAGAGGGGGSGAVNGKLVYTNAATAITIGSNGAPGGTTNFGNLLSAVGGDYGRTGGDSGGNGGSGGSPYGGEGGKGALNGGQPQLSNASAPSSSPYVQIIGNITTGGGGGGGAANKSATNGSGSGIGTGGNGGSTLAVNGGNATGYGAGGGGGGARSANEVNTNGGSGTQGVVYVLRGF